MKKLLARISLLTAFLLFGLNAPVFSADTVLVIPKGAKASFWEYVSKGARQAGRELQLNVIIRGPKNEDQHDAQTYIIDFGIKQEVDAIVIAPSHEDIIKPWLDKAVQAGIKVVLIDSAVQSFHHPSFVASDNYLAGKIAAEHLASLISSSGDVILARHLKGHASTREREESFLRTIATSFPDINVVADPYVGSSRGKAFHTIHSLLQKYTNVQAIFCDSEEASLGILKALDQKSDSKRPKFIGFDFNETIRLAILSRHMDATIVQNPYQMGYQGVAIASSLLQDEEVPATVHTDLMLVTRKNITTPEVQVVIEQYLNKQEPSQ